jgi:hypothetical protein
MAPTADRLRQAFSYDPEQGRFTKCRTGKIVGSINNLGYRMIWVDGRLCTEHRLAWLYVHGEWPARCIDHINGIKHDNRIANLREATHSQNSMNVAVRPDANSSGFKGVSWHRGAKKWRATINKSRKQIHLGFFSDPAAAHAAYAAAASKHFGEFARAE